MVSQICGNCGVVLEEGQVVVLRNGLLGRTEEVIR